MTQKNKILFELIIPHLNKYKIMKKILLFLILISYVNYKSIAQVTQKSHLYKEKLEQLKKINKSKYVGNTIKELLNDKNVKGYNSYHWLAEPPGCLSGIALEYDKRLCLNVHLKSPKYQKKFSVENKWSFKEFQKEKVFIIIIDDDRNYIKL